MKLGFNIVLVCVIALICITAVAITGLAMGHDGTVISLTFVALGAIPASILTLLLTKHKSNNEK